MQLLLGNIPMPGNIFNKKRENKSAEMPESAAVSQAMSTLSR